jgi:hypothetical protein
MSGGIAQPALGEPPALIPRTPVRPVLSGRDQASATPSIAISHPLTGADAQEYDVKMAIM